MLDEKVSALIADIYEGPRNLEAWRRVLDGLLDRTGSRFLMLSAVDLKRREYSATYFHGADDARFLDGMNDYRAEWYRADPTLEFAARNPHAGFTTTAKAIADRDADPATEAYLRWTSDILGCGHTTVRYTAPVGDMTLGISINASSDRVVHDPEDIRLFLMLFEHVERALRLAARPPDLEHSTEARLLLDQRGVVRKMSEGARALLARRDGLWADDRRLCASRPEDRARLDTLIKQVTQGFTHGSAGGGVAMPRPSGRRDWLLLASPLPRSFEPFASFEPAVMIRIVDPDGVMAPAAVERWANLFGLTPTERRLLERLMADDGDLRCAAEQLGMRHSTARVHMRNIFDKTGVRSQAALMRLLQRLAD